MLEWYCTNSPGLIQVYCSNFPLYSGAVISAAGAFSPDYYLLRT
jgi:hypothetical protein